MFRPILLFALAAATHGVPVTNITADSAVGWPACSKSNLQKRISSYSHSAVSSCSGWRDANSAQFSMVWRSVNKDAVKVSYGWCPDGCKSSYRSSACSWGSERYEKGTNFEQSLSASVSNRHFKNPVSCIEIKCDNWHETCQLEISSVSVTGNNVEDEFVDKSLPPAVSQIADAVADSEIFVHHLCRNNHCGTYCCHAVDQSCCNTEETTWPCVGVHYTLCWHADSQMFEESSNKGSGYKVLVASNGSGSWHGHWELDDWAGVSNTQDVAVTTLTGAEAQAYRDQHSAGMERN